MSSTPGQLACCCNSSKSVILMPARTNRVRSTCQRVQSAYVSYQLSARLQHPYIRRVTVRHDHVYVQLKAEASSVVVRLQRRVMTKPDALSRDGEKTVYSCRRQYVDRPIESEYGESILERIQRRQRPPYALKQQLQYSHQRHVGCGFVPVRNVSRRAVCRSDDDESAA